MHSNRIDITPYNQSLHVLEMSLGDSEEEEIAAIAHALASSQTIRKLNISNISMSISLKGERAIVSALSKNQSLHILDLTLFDSFGDESAVVFASALETNHTLRVLTFCNTNIGEKGEVAIATSLLKNQSLQELHLIGNFTEEGAVAIARVLSTNQTLQKLSLEGHHIKSCGAAAIATALEQNQTLHTLELKFGHWSDESADIAIALKTNQTLCELVLYIVICEVDVVAALASALKVNRSLRVLEFWYTFLDDKDAVEIAEALQTNTTLSTLKIVSDEVGAQGTIAIASASIINQSLKTLDLLELYQDTWSLDEHLKILSAKHLIAKSMYANTMIGVSSYLPDHIIPHAIDYMSTHHQHVSKIFSLLREKPELFAYY